MHIMSTAKPLYLIAIGASAGGMEDIHLFLIIRRLMAFLILKRTQCQYHVWINADVSLMERVVQNLIYNAVSTYEHDNIQVFLEVAGN